MLAFLLLIGSWAVSEPLPVLQGEYQLSSEVRTLTGWTEERIFTTSAEGRRRYKDLLGQGWQCRLSQSWATCKIFEAEPLAETERIQVLEQFEERKRMEFGPAFGPPELVLEAPEYRSYELLQPLTWGDRVWDRLELFVTKSFVKLNLPGKGQGVEEAFTLLADQALERQTRFTRRESDLKSQTLVLGLIWRPVRD